MGQSDRLLFALLLASMLPVFIAFLMGQSTMILLLGLTLVATGLRGRNDAAAGLGLAMLLIKPQLVVIPVALLVWRGRLRGLAYFAVGCLAATRFWLVGYGGVAAHLGFLSSGAMAPEYHVSHTLLGLALSIAGDNEGWQAYLAMAGAVLVGGGAVLWRRRDSGSFELTDQLAIVVLASLLVSPYLRPYDLTLWSLPLATAWSWASTGRGRWLLAACFIAPWLSVALSGLGPISLWPTVVAELLLFTALCRRYWLGLPHTAAAAVPAGTNG